MNYCITVYFDTYFYVWLAKATDEEADEIISELNKLNVRPVLSGQIILELLSNSSKSERDKSLVSRMSKFKIQPYRISSNVFEESSVSNFLSWEVLLLDGNDRASLANLFKSLFDMETKAESWSILAKTNHSSAEEEKIQESLSSFLTAFGFEKDTGYTNEEAAEKNLSFTSELFSNISDLFSDEQKKIFEKIDFSASPTVENLNNVSSQLLQIIGDENIRRLQEGEKIVHSTTNSDNRPYKVAVGEASAKELKNLGNTYRDSKNIHLFITHQAEIDLLQLDSAQINQINNKGKKLHRLVELKLDKRCFCANSLKNTVEIIKEKKQELSL